MKFEKMTKPWIFWALALCVASAHSQDAPVDPQKLKAAILQDVRQQGLDKSQQVKAAVQTAQEAVLVKTWEQVTLKSNPVTPAQRDDAYRELLALLGSNEYRFQYVVAKEQALAQAVLEAMRTNPAWDQIDYKAIAKTDPNLRVQKTDWVNMTMLMGEFRPVVKTLKVGEVHAVPVQAQNLWHVIGLLETRPLNPPAYEQIKTNVEKLAEQKVLGEKIKSLLQAKEKSKK